MLIYNKLNSIFKNHIIFGLLFKRYIIFDLKLCFIEKYYTFRETESQNSYSSEYFDRYD